MSLKFVIDGAPGSGKTTLLFGKVGDEEINKNIPCLKDYGFKIIPEAISTTADQMRKEGKTPANSIKEFINRTINRSIKESFRKYKYICIIERGLPGYFFMESIFKIKLPQAYSDYFKVTDYNSPIFVLEPIYDFDMSKRNKHLRVSRVATLKQRKDIFKKTVNIYKKFGYEVVIVPLYSEDIKINNQKRIEYILKFIF